MRSRVDEESPLFPALIKINLRSKLSLLDHRDGIRSLLSRFSQISKVFISKSMYDPYNTQYCALKNRTIDNDLFIIHTAHRFLLIRFSTW